MRVSVAMCTYNGARYIREQLDSILHQSRQVDEIVISDDGSTDDTIHIVRAYVEKSPQIQYAVNKPNKGFKQNFMDTIRRCSGDVIFLSDQDDRWHPDKVGKVLNWFNQNPTLDVVFTNAEVIDDQSIRTGEKIFDRIGFDEEKQRAAMHGYMMDILCVNNRATGATMSIRKSFIESFKDEWYSDEKYHDAALVLEAMGREVGGFIPDCLMDYRIHAHQTSGLEIIERLYILPYKPMLITYEGEKRWTAKTQMRVAFSRKRTAFKYSWLGCKVWFNLPLYVKAYGTLWYKAVNYDLKEAMNHSKVRLKNIVQNRLKK